ncbi:MAG: flagellar hook protein FlgE [Candidatus Rokubacteria bacterium]|nr:flagellar hook protein FlgE [Candidatus Rokubacteria bacterium]
MLRVLSTGVTGLRANQAALDVIGNNVANINTSGFKASRASFADLMSQTLSSEQAPTTNTGGKDAMQIGLGTGLGAIRSIFSQGVIATTDHQTDLAIQGNGLFVLQNGSDTIYSRAGAFSIDADGKLIDSTTGYRVQGTGGDVTIAPGSTIAGNATTQSVFGGNLDASQADGTTHVATFTVNDSLGVARTLTVTFTKDFAGGAGQWDWAVTESDANITGLAGATGTIDFDSAGAISAGATGALSITYAAAAGVTTPQAVTLDFGSATNTVPMTGFAGTSTAAMTSQDGFAAGSLQSFGIGTDGSIIGSYDNGRTQTIDQLALAIFANPAGLVREGQNLFRESENSGPASVGNAGSGGRGTLMAGALEGSNVDLAREFTELISAQRGFEASARIIRAGDEVLQTVVNLMQ